ncbi:hypothetical protein BHE74_00057361 [Ensete ventricosum]|nr:hypothetical protein BHE74_00057361 [Ensete ventricosum]
MLISSSAPHLHFLLSWTPNPCLLRLLHPPRPWILAPYKLLDHPHLLLPLPPPLVQVVRMSDLPPGFRFFPTDEELVVHFLSRKASRLPCQPDIVPVLDLRRFDPWQLNGRLNSKALQGGSHCYFFSHATVNKVSPSGYWMPVGAKETVTSGDKDVGTKSTLVFHIGEAPLGVKTSWVMHEYRLLEDGAAVPSSRTNRNGSSSASRARGNKRPVSAFSPHAIFPCDRSLTRSLFVRQDLNLAICRVQEASFFGVEETELSCLDEVFLSLDDLDEISMPY